MRRSTDTQLFASRIEPLLSQHLERMQHRWMLQRIQPIIPDKLLQFGASLIADVRQ